jgi:hypothetical protein
MISKEVLPKHLTFETVKDLLFHETWICDCENPFLERNASQYNWAVPATLCFQT